MFKICTFIEKVIRFIKIKLKICFWKLKYGKRIKIGKGLQFRKRFTINITTNGYLEIGDDVFFNNDCSINCHKKIIIGNDNLFGENVKIYDHNHVFNESKKQLKNNFQEREIIIGNENWFATNVVVLSKCRIGNANVIGNNVILNDEYDSENIIKLSKENLKISKINFRY